MRTGLGAAVAALGVGRVAPELIGGTDWPYVVLGVGYALLGVALLALGVLRQRDVRRALDEGGFAGALGSVGSRSDRRRRAPSP